MALLPTCHPARDPRLCLPMGRLCSQSEWGFEQEPRQLCPQSTVLYMYEVRDCGRASTVGTPCLTENSGIPHPARQRPEWRSAKPQYGLLAGTTVSCLGKQGTKGSKLCWLWAGGLHHCCCSTLQVGLCLVAWLLSHGCFDWYAATVPPKLCDSVSVPSAERDSFAAFESVICNSVK